jgi:hypothetical protein
MPSEKAQKIRQKTENFVRANISCGNLLQISTDGNSRCLSRFLRKPSAPGSQRVGPPLRTLEAPPKFDNNVCREVSAQGRLATTYKRLLLIRHDFSLYLTRLRPQHSFLA